MFQESVAGRTDDKLDFDALETKDTQPTLSAGSMQLSYVHELKPCIEDLHDEKPLMKTVQQLKQSLEDVQELKPFTCDDHETKPSLETLNGINGARFINAKDIVIID